MNKKNDSERINNIITKKIKAEAGKKIKDVDN